MTMSMTAGNTLSDARRETTTSTPAHDELASCAGGWRYAVCLTKSDKGGPKAVQKAEAAVRRAIQETGCPEPAAIVPTSSKSKGGRREMWQLMRRVVL